MSTLYRIEIFKLIFQVIEIQPFEFTYFLHFFRNGNKRGYFKIYIDLTRSVYSVRDKFMDHDP